MQQVEIPEYIDTPMQFFLWEVDELVPVMLMIALGIITSTLTLMWIPIYFVWKMYMSFKERKMLGYLFHFSFRYLAMPLNLKFTNGAIQFYHQ